MIFDNVATMVQAVFSITFVIAAFFLMSWFFQLAFNHAIPSMAASIDGANYDRTNFTDLKYTTAVSFMLLAWFLFGNKMLDNAWNIVGVLPFEGMVDNVLGDTQRVVNDVETGTNINLL